jgi:uncharacterized protein YjbI with pentapeptide repeats
MNISPSLKELVTTGKCSSGILNNIDITAGLYHSGAIAAHEDYYEYVLNKFDGKLVLNEAKMQHSSFRWLRLKYIDLRKSDLGNSDLSDVIWEEADFSEASLGRARLNRAILRGANFEKADLNSSDLLGADFSNCNFSGANLDGADIRAADFTGANCKDVIFDGDGPKDPRFLGANFTDANLEGARIDIKSLDFVYLCRTIMPDGTVSDRDCNFVQSFVQGRA